jgi:hypothetical protein
MEIMMKKIGIERVYGWKHKMDQERGGKKVHYNGINELLTKSFFRNKKFFTALITFRAFQV